MTRAQWTLVGALILQVLLLLALGLGGDETGAAQARALFPSLAEATLARVELQSGADDAGDPLVIELAGESWTLPGRDGFPADGSKVDELLDRLKQLQVRRSVVSGSRYHAAFKVDTDDFERRVKLSDAEGNELADLILGSSPNYRVSHVRSGDDDRVFEARGLSSWDLNPEVGAWIDKDLIIVPAEDVVAVRIENGAGAFELRRDLEDTSGGAWQLVGDDGSTLDDSKVDALVRSLAALKLTEPAGRTEDGAFGLEPPTATLELDYHVTSPAEADAEPATPVTDTVRLVVGAELTEPGDDDTVEATGKYYAALSDSDYAVVLGKWDAEKIVDKKSVDLLAAED